MPDHNRMAGGSGLRHSGLRALAMQIDFLGGIVRGDGKDKVDPRIERELESRRPAEARSRRDSVYCRPVTDFSRCGIVKDGYIYRVGPTGDFEHRDLAWIGEMQKALIRQKYPGTFPAYPDWSDELVDACCTAYWECSASASPVWEILASSFVICEILSDRIVSVSEARGGWLQASS